MFTLMDARAPVCGPSVALARGVIIVPVHVRDERAGCGDTGFVLLNTLSPTKSVFVIRAEVGTWKLFFLLIFF